MPGNRLEAGADFFVKTPTFQRRFKTSLWDRARSPLPNRRPCRGFLHRGAAKAPKLGTAYDNTLPQAMRDLQD